MRGKNEETHRRNRSHHHRTSPCNHTCGPCLQFGGGYATCSSTWSYTWANSTASITHMHQADLLKRQVDRPAGVSTFKGHYRYNGATWMELDTSGNYSGAVFGCSA